MDIHLNKIIIFLTENHLFIIALLAFLSVVLALITWMQIKQGWRFYVSKRKLITLLREKNL